MSRNSTDPVVGVEHEPVHPAQKRWVVYTTYTVIVLGLLAVALIVFGNHQNNQDQRVASQRAGELQTQLAAAGLGTWDTDVIEQVLGADGGQVCANAGATLFDGNGVGLVNGSGGPGLRPSTTTADVARAGRIVVQVYCPDKLSEYDDNVPSLHLSDSTSQDT